MLHASWTRRDFLKTTTVGLTAFAGRVTQADTTQTNPEGFFTLGTVAGRRIFLDPQGKPFFSLGLNHIDSSTLRYPENDRIWRETYGGDQLRWLRESVGPNLRRWGFNTVGWAQEVTVRKAAHTANFVADEYHAVGLPYCHLLPFAETHQWNAWHKNPDFASSEFEDWCDYTARDACGRLRDDPLLIGYFYVDTPTWIHTTPASEWRGPLFDPERLKTDEGRKELTTLAARYHRVTHDAIRRYDPHHLILGDRYEANAPLPMEVIEGARPYIDALCLQDFKQPVEHLAEWHKKTGLPVLWADGARPITVKDDSGKYREGSYMRNDGAWYAEVVAGLRNNPGCIGAHLCGAYLRNRSRRRGLLDEQERPDEENIALITAANEDATRWMQSLKP